MGLFQLVLLISVFMGFSLAKINIPFLSNKKKYTPLVFFTAPKGMNPETDDMEKMVKEVEKDINVRVERLDVVRDPKAEVALSTLTTHSPPFLYHRESLQVVYIDRTSRKQGKGNDEKPFPIQKERVRAWAKGRFLPPQQSTSAANAAPPTLLSQEDNALDQKDLLEDATMTPEQLAGKEAMKKRTEARGRALKEKQENKQ